MCTGRQRLLILGCIALGACCSDTHAQSEDAFKKIKRTRTSGIGFVFGYHYFETHFLEAGLVKSYKPTPLGRGYIGHFLTGGVEAGPADTFVLAPKASYLAAAGLQSGITLRINALVYTDFSNYAMALRPELGFRFARRFHVLLGYAVGGPLTDASPAYNQPFNASLIYLLSKQALYYYE